VVVVAVFVEGVVVAVVVVVVDVVVVAVVVALFEDMNAYMDVRI
jgi:hypothetical protein